MKLIAICLFLLSCSELKKHGPKDPPEMDAFNKLEAEYNNTFPLYSGWPNPKDCDGLLWASIAKAAGVGQIHLTDAMGKPGEWFRSPDKKCYPEGRSRSDISNDMLVGLMLEATDKILYDLYEYGKKNAWIMGRGDIGATLMKPAVRNLLGTKLNIKLGERMPFVWDEKDYVRHIQSLMIYQLGKETGFIYTHEKNLLKSYCKTDYLPCAILARYTNDYSVVYDLLKHPEAPTYVRGQNVEQLRKVHWLFATFVLIEGYYAEN